MFLKNVIVLNVTEKTRMRAIKCSVKSVNAFPANPNPKPVQDKYGALHWIRQVGYGHVADCDCTLPKCLTSRRYIEFGCIKLNEKGKPYCDHTVSGYKYAL